MKAHQIFQHCSPAFSRGIFHYLRTEQKEVYRTALATLATGRKLRPIFVQRKSPEQQYEWLQKTVQIKGSDGVCEHLLQLWLLKAQRNLLVKFLDGVGIEHDGEGAADDLPDEIDAKKLEKTVKALLADYDPELVAIYLHTFQLQKANGWDAIRELLEKEPKLQLGAVPEAPAAKEETAASPAPEAEVAPGSDEA
ncbi:MAG: hypothetical protein KDM63_03475 [Verrucomicrobiae bacterium]|nr:hypothetical protein [Verrucomicrobiae bacterium]